MGKALVLSNCVSFDYKMSEEQVLPFVHPFTLGCFGQTGSGKTHFVKKILTEPGFIYPPPSRILWFYAEDQELYKNMENVEFYSGLPTQEIYDTLLPSKRNVIVLDDMMTEAMKSSFVSSLFYRGSHHR